MEPQNSCDDFKRTVYEWHGLESIKAVIIGKTWGRPVSKDESNGGLKRTRITNRGLGRSSKLLMVNENIFIFVCGK